MDKNILEDSNFSSNHSNINSFLCDLKWSGNLHWKVLQKTSVLLTLSLYLPTCRCPLWQTPGRSHKTNGHFESWLCSFNHQMEVKNARHSTCLLASTDQLGLCSAWLTTKSLNTELYSAVNFTWYHLLLTKQDYTFRKDWWVLFLTDSQQEQQLKGTRAWMGTCYKQTALWSSRLKGLLRNLYLMRWQEML